MRWEPKGTSELLLKKQSPWQIIRLYKNGAHYWMSLNGIAQFHTAETYQSHKYMCQPPLQMAANPKTALVIGGGDGFAARELLRCPSIEQITNVEIDRDLIRLTKTHPIMQLLTENSFNQRRVRVIAGDGIGYLLSTSDKFDIIIDDCEYEFTSQANNPKARAEKARYAAYLACLVSKLTPGGISCIMDPPVSFILEPKKGTSFHQIMKANSFLFSEDGLLLDSNRYSQDELKEILKEENPIEENDTFKFFKTLTPYVASRIFMSQVLGPEVYIYCSNQPFKARR